MKRFAKLIPLLLALLLLLCACRDTTYTLEKGGMTFTVDPNNRTITQGENVYRYSFTKDSSGFTYFSFTYPNGGTYRAHTVVGQLIPENTQDYDPDTYLPGELLYSVLEEEMKDPDAHYNFFFLLPLLFGLWPALAPESAATFRLSWWQKNKPEPTEGYIFLTRLGGIALVALSLICFFVFR